MGERGTGAGDQLRGHQRRARRRRGQHVRVLEVAAGGRADQHVVRAAAGLLLGEDPEGLGLHAAGLEGHRGAGPGRARGTQAQEAVRGAGSILDLVHGQPAVERVQPGGHEARRMEVAHRAQDLEYEVLALARAVGPGQGDRLAGLADLVRGVEDEGRSARGAVKVGTDRAALGRGRVRGQGPGRADACHHGQYCGRCDELGLDGHFKCLPKRQCSGKPGGPYRFRRHWLTCVAGLFGWRAGWASTLIVRLVPDAGWVPAGPMEHWVGYNRPDGTLGRFGGAAGGGDAGGWGGGGGWGGWGDAGRWGGEGGWADWDGWGGGGASWGLGGRGTGLRLGRRARR